MVGRIMASIDVHVPTSRTCEYGILHGKRNFAGAFKLRMFRWGDYSGSSGWVKCNKNSPAKGKSKEGESQDVTKRVE